MASNLKSTTKSIYEISKQQSSVQNLGLPELIINDFDDEQIWQQLELRNDSSVQNLLTNVARLVASKDSLTFKAHSSECSGNKSLISRDDGDEENLSDAPSFEDDDSDTDIELSKIKERLSAIENGTAPASGSDSELDFDFDVGQKGASNDDAEKGTMDDDEGFDDESDSEKPKTKKKPSYRSEVDDRFFKLADLEEFLNSEDAKEERRQRQNIQKEKQESEDESDDEDDEDDDDIDLFQKLSSEDENEEVHILNLFIIIYYCFLNPDSLQYRHAFINISTYQ